MTIDAARYGEILHDPDRYLNGMDFIRRFTDQEVAIADFDQLWPDVRTLMYFAFQNVQWCFTGTTAFVWGFEGEYVFQENFRIFHEKLAKLLAEPLA